MLADLDVDADPRKMAKLYDLKLLDEQTELGFNGSRSSVRNLSALQEGLLTGHIGGVAAKI